MLNKRIKICFIGANPYFEGGVGLYQRNLIEYLNKKNKNIDIEVIYFGKENKVIQSNNIKYIQIKNTLPYPIDQIFDNFKALNYIKKNNFDIINSHALWGYWMRFYKKKKNQKLIHTYHGVTYNYFKIHLKRFSVLKKIILSPILLIGYILEKSPMKNADKIICVSEKVKIQLEKLYGSKKDTYVLRTGVNLKEFKVKDKKTCRKILALDENKTYGLYVGKGGYWIKGLDRAINISKEIYKKNNNYRLIILGADYKKIKELIKYDFIIYHENVSRDEISKYYNASDFLFYLSRYDGGAPTLVVSEAMASGCPIIFSKDSEQEIIENEKNGVIVNNFGVKEAENIIDLLKNKKRKETIIKNAMNTTKRLSVEKWGEEYFKRTKILS